jgi:hypothetical protein
MLRISPSRHFQLEIYQRTAGIGYAAGNEPFALPKTVNSMIPSGVARSQLSIVSRTKRHLVGGISLKIVLRTMAFVAHQHNAYSPNQWGNL